MADNIFSDETERHEMICDKCHYQSGCEELPDKNGRCSDYLKDGEIIISDDLTLNPSDSIVYDYDLIKDVLDVDSP
ncbi:MAG: hypothetical protein PVG87_16185 [Desulfobacteraceae bacterium]|jgi:hypothetical protein